MDGNIKRSPFTGASEHTFDVSGATGIMPAGLANFFSLAAFAYAFPVCFFPFYDQVCTS
jgi:hypothetical protein